MKPRICLLVLLLVSGPALCLAAKEDYLSSIDPFLKAQFQDKKSCMVVGLVDEHGQQIFSGGMLDNGTDGKPDGDTMFFIGSVSKTFTALLLADMAERGEVKLDDPVAKILPGITEPPAFNGRQVTLLDLATHTAGLPVDPNNMTGKDTRQQYESYTADKMEAFFSGYKLSREPGSEFSYSNVGMSLLGDALVRKSGKSFESLLIERICQPLGMSNTCTTLPDELKPRLAMGHEKNGDPSTPWQLQAYLPAGGVLSNANDLLKYASAHAGLTTSALTPAIETTHLIRHTDTRGLPDLPGTFGQTAMDWMDRGALQPPGMQLLGHAGGAGSYHAWVGFDMKQHRGVVVLSTDNDVSVECVGWTLLQGKPLTEQSSKEFEHEMVGIGVALDLDKQTKLLLITRVFPESPAAKGGLSAGCIIKRIDDVPLDGKSLAACTRLLRGNVGTRVTLEVMDGNGKVNTVELIRQKFLIRQS